MYLYKCVRVNKHLHVCVHANKSAQQLGGCNCAAFSVFSFLYRCSFTRSLLSLSPLLQLDFSLFILVLSAIVYSKYTLSATSVMFLRICSVSRCNNNGATTMQKQMSNKCLPRLSFFHIFVSTSMYIMCFCLTFFYFFSFSLFLYFLRICLLNAFLLLFVKVLLQQKTLQLAVVD